MAWRRLRGLDGVALRQVEVAAEGIEGSASGVSLAVGAVAGNMRGTYITMM